MKVSREEWMALERTHTANGFFIEKCFYKMPFRFAQMRCPNDHVITRKATGSFRERRCPKCGPNSLKHGHSIGGKKSPAYLSWSGAVSRCTNKNSINYPYYGGRGIKMCRKWSGKNGFCKFLADMGEPPETDVRYKLVRIDRKKGYTPGNCLWVKNNNKKQIRKTMISEPT